MSTIPTGGKLSDKSPLARTHDAEDFLKVLVPSGCFEVRRKGKGVTGKVYGAGQWKEAAADLTSGSDTSVKAYWVTLNGTTLEPFDWKGPPLTSDKDVALRNWLLVDLDPNRPSDTNSTNEELEAAHAVVSHLRDTLMAEGWPEPMQSMSGNGYHLLYRIDLPTDDGGLVQRVLAGLAQRFSTDQVTVDTANYNPSRIVKVPGTWSRKGPDTFPDRPWRVAKLLTVPKSIIPVPVELLERAASKVTTTKAIVPVTLSPAPVTFVAKPGGMAFPRDVKGPGRGDAITQYLRDHGVMVKYARQGSDGTKVYLAFCPVTGVEAHGTDLCVMVPNDGPLVYVNSHNRGVGVKWAHLRAAIDPTYGQAKVQPGGTTDAGDARDPEERDVRQDLEVEVLAGMAQFDIEQRDHAGALEAMRIDLEGYGWILRDIYEQVTTALGERDGRAVSGPLLRAHGISDTTAEALMAPRHPDAVKAAVEWLADWMSRQKNSRTRDRARDLLSDNEQPDDGVLDQVRDLLEQHHATSVGRDADTSTAALDDVLARIESGRGESLRGLSTGVRWMDEATFGLRGLMMLAASPGVGKSNLALWLQRCVLMTEPKACCVFVSGELSRHDVWTRLWAQTANVPETFVVLGTRDAFYGKVMPTTNGPDMEVEKANQRLQEAKQRLHTLRPRMYVHDVTGARDVTVTGLERVVRQVMRTSGCERAFVVIDSFQAVGAFLTLENEKGIRSEIERDNLLTAAMLRLQARLDQPVLCISELNKAAMDQGDGDTSMTGMRGSARLAYSPNWVARLVDPMMVVEEEAPTKNGTTHTRTKKVRQKDQTDSTRTLWLEVQKARGGGKHGRTVLTHLYRTGNWLEGKR
jgi:replicative DNA helicase